MPVLRPDWNLEITAENVLFAQAADSAAISRRSPRLVDVAHRAAQHALTLIDPVVIYREVPVKSIEKERLYLEDNNSLSGPLILEHLQNATVVLVLICTIGGRLEDQATSFSREDISFSFALDSAGSFAVELLANHVCRYFETFYNQRGMKTSIPLNPGMIGWSLLPGQIEVFRVLEGINSEVSLSESGMMTPRKSVSIVLGAGEEILRVGSRCDYCSYHGRCFYKDKSEAHSCKPITQLERIEL